MLDFCIPASFFIVVDDVGWWCGEDHRYKGGPSRSGIGRRHVPEDYAALIELGRRLDMRFQWAFVVGEWDRWNLLKDVPGSNKHWSDWDNASRLDPRIDEARDLLNAGAAHFELTMHGLVHMYWHQRDVMSYAEFYSNVGGMPDEVRMNPREILKQHIETYLELIHRNGLTMPVRSFVPPCFRYIFSKGDGELSHLLAQYGILYLSTPFAGMGCREAVKPVDAGAENGIITVDRNRDFTRWYEVGPPPPEALRPGFFGLHWPNLLHPDPARNMETIDRWTAYFQRYQNRFDILPARDAPMAYTQALYRRFTAATPTSEGFSLDFTAVDAENAAAAGDGPWFHVRRGLTPRIERGTGELFPCGGGEAFTAWRLRRENGAKTARVRLEA